MFNRGLGVYLCRANKYRYSLEKHCYDTYCTVYCFCYECLTSKSGVTLTAMYMLYNKTKLKIDKPRTDLKECEIIHQPKNDENLTSLINAGPQLNVGYK